MICKFFINFFLIYFLFFNNCFAEFGEYKYTKYLGIQQQIQNQRARAIRMQKMYYQNPTRNIKYPTSDNPYPNIQTTSYKSINKAQRYSPSYYQNHY